MAEQPHVGSDEAMSRQAEGHEHRIRTDRWESFADRQIREAMERGEFENLPGAGRPLKGLGAPYDPEWWARDYMRRDQVRSRADEVRRLVRDEVPRLRVSRDPEAAATRLAEIDAMIDAVNEHLPPTDRIPSLDR